MIRAIFFDFYSVWKLDKFSVYIELARQHDPEMARELEKVIHDYYLGLADIEAVTTSFRFKLHGYLDLPDKLFEADVSDIPPGFVDFTRYLHGHFLKLGMLANVGNQERELLNNLNAQYGLFEVMILSIDMGESIYGKESFLNALSSIGEPPDSCLVVTGHDEYQHFAESCGIKVLRFEGFEKMQTSITQLIGK